MKIVLTDSGLVVELSRRNLKSLLAKLDGHPPNSACTIEKNGVFVRAVENYDHYSDRRPGDMHPDTEREIS